MKLIWYVIVFVCVALLPLQTGFNTRLGKSIGSPICSSMICFIVGAIAADTVNTNNPVEDC